MRIRCALILLALIALIGCKEQEDRYGKSSIYGLVTDRVTSAPISDASVSLLPIGRSVLTGQEGAYRFDGLLPGTYKLEVKKAAYPKPVSKLLNVEAGQQLELHFQLDSRSGKLIAITSEGGSLSQLDFGGERDNSSRSFTLLNDSDNSNVEWSIEHSLPWIESVTPNKGKFNANEQVSILVKIDRRRVNEEKAQGLLHVLSKEGNLEIKVLAEGKLTPEVQLLGCEAISEEEVLATLGVQDPLPATIKHIGVQVGLADASDWRKVPAAKSAASGIYLSAISTGNTYPLGSVLRVRPYASDVNEDVMWTGEEVRVPIEKHPPVVRIEAGGSGYPNAYSVVLRVEQLGFPPAESIVVNVSSSLAKAQAGDADVNSIPTSQLLEHGHRVDTLRLKAKGGKELEPNVNYYIFFRLKGAKLGMLQSDVLMHRRVGQPWYCIESIRLMVQLKDLGKATWEVADGMCKGSSLGGYSNWRLPTKEELAAIYGVRDAVGEFGNFTYWSNTASINNKHVILDFKNGAFYWRNNNEAHAVRAVRSYKTP